MITSPEYPFKQTLKAIKKHKPDFVCYRNKQYYDENEILTFLEFAKNHSKPIIHYDSLKNPSLLNLFEGIHLPSSKLDLIKEFKNKIVFASTHDLEEVKKAKNASFITFSPIFDSKGRKGLGVEILEKISKYHPNVIALGGIITQKEVEKIKNSKAKGFASIRYFYLT